MNSVPNRLGSSSPLSPTDEAALEWLLENNLDPSHAPAELAARISKLARLLALAGNASVSPDPALRESVLDRLTAMDRPGAILSDADQDALDAVLMAGMDPSRVPGVLRERAERVVAIASLLKGPDLEYECDLTDRVMAAVASSVISAEAERPVLARIGGRLSDIVSVAAVILIAASVVWPVMSTVRENAMRTTNQANLAVAGLGLGAYAADFADSLPRVQEPHMQRQWWQVTPTAQTSNASNLFALKRLQYVPEDALRSPGNPHAPSEPMPADAVDWQNVRQVSYSYALPVEGRSEASAVGVVLADRSPIVLRVLAGQPIRVDENSPNHDGRGQHMLRGDGSVLWAEQPYTQYGDHVYLPRPIERAIESVRQQLRLPVDRLPPPQHHSDVFLGP